MAKHALERIDSPVGSFEWATLDGEGKENLNNVKQYVINLILGGEKAEAFKAKMDAFWQANIPNGVPKALHAEPSSMGYYPHYEYTGETDDDGEKIKVETGKTEFRFKTGTHFADGKPKVIKIFNSKGAEVDLDDKKVGNDSRGRVKGAMAIYTTEKNGKVINAGVTLYLDAVQLTKLVEYAGGPSFDEVEDEDGEDFEGAGEMGAVADSDDDSNTAADSPKL